jgi:hypothetical protein
MILEGITISGNTTDNTDAGDGGEACLLPSTAPDEWYTIEITGPETVTFTLSMCDTQPTYGAQVFIRDAFGDVLACSHNDCSFGGWPLFQVDLPPGTYDLAVDGFFDYFGVYSGELAGTALPHPCPFEPKCSGVDEGEPCDDTGQGAVNGGCNTTPATFGSIELNGPPVCGGSWATNGQRDTDWFAFSTDETTDVFVELRANFPMIAYILEMSPGGECPVISIPMDLTAYSNECDGEFELGAAYDLGPGDYVLFVANGTVGGPSTGWGFPCGLDGAPMRYEVELRTPPPPCPLDLSGNGAVDFADILLVVADWGPCPTIGGDDGADGSARRSNGPTSCFLDPPCDGDDEGEPCDMVNPDMVNGGCNSTPAVFGTVEIDGPALCGTNWAHEGSRDTDWFAFEVTEVTVVEIDLRAETDSVSFIAEMSDGGACPVIGIPQGVSAISRFCDEEHRLGEGFILDPGHYILFVGAGGFDYDGPFDGWPCPDGTLTNNAYEVELRSAVIYLPCPTDLNGDHVVDFADILLIIAEWGPCPTS